MTRADSLKIIFSVLFAFSCVALLQVRVNFPAVAATIQTLMNEDDAVATNAGEAMYCKADQDASVTFVGCSGFF